MNDNNVTLESIQQDVKLLLETIKIHQKNEYRLIRKILREIKVIRSELPEGASHKDLPESGL